MFRFLKSLVVLVFIVFLAGCEEDELRNQNNELKQTITNLENQIQRMNDKSNWDSEKYNKTKEDLRHEFELEFNNTLTEKINKKLWWEFFKYFSLSLSFFIALVVLFIFSLNKSYKKLSDEYKEKIDNLEKDYEEEIAKVEKKYKQEFDKVNEDFNAKQNMIEEHLKYQASKKKEREDIVNEKSILARKLRDIAPNISEN